MTNMKKIRLIDANEAKKKLLSYYSFVNENTNKSNYTGETLMSYEVVDMIEDCIEGTPTVDPETLSIVQNLRAELERMKAIMRYNGIVVIPSKYPGGRSEWNIPKLRG